jgi:hypothetical protein
VDKQTSEKPRSVDRLTAIVTQLAKNASALRYGTVAVSLRIHDGRIVDITHTVTESTREPEKALRKSDDF